MVFKVVVHQAEEGGFWAEVPALPGCYTFADTLDALRERIQEAIHTHLGLVENPIIPEQAEVFEIAV